MRRRYAVELWDWAGHFYGRTATYRFMRRAARQARLEKQHCAHFGCTECLWVVVRT